MKAIIEIALIFAAGFVAAIFTWPKVKQIWFGAKEEAERLRQKARDLETAVRSKL